MRPLLKTIVSCGSHASFAFSCAFSRVAICAGSFQRPIDFFRRLRRDGNGSIRQRGHLYFEPVSAGDSTGGVYNDGFFDERVALGNMRLMGNF